MKKYFFFLSMFFSSVNSFANFESKESLFDAFRRVGLTTVVEIADLPNTNNVFVHQVTKSGEEVLSINESNRVEALTDLDYSEPSFLTTTMFKAYVVSDIVLCYASSDRATSLSLRPKANEFEKCYLLPNKVREVARKIRAL